MLLLLDNRRLDEWVSEDRLRELAPGDKKEGDEDGDQAYKQHAAVSQPGYC